MSGTAFSVYRQGEWDYVVSTYFFCYLNRRQQTDVLIQMCRVANRKVIVYCGVQRYTGRLDYDWQQIAEAVPRARRDPQSNQMRVSITLG